MFQGLATNTLILADIAKLNCKQPASGKGHCTQKWVLVYVFYDY